MNDQLINSLFLIYDLLIIFNEVFKLDEKKQ